MKIFREKWIFKNTLIEIICYVGHAHQFYTDEIWRAWVIDAQKLFSGTDFKEENYKGNWGSTNPCLNLGIFPRFALMQTCMLRKKNSVQEQSNKLNITEKWFQ